MVTIADILQRKWYGAHWAISEDDYATLQWLDEKGNPKRGQPTEKEIRAFSAEVADMIKSEAAIDAAPNRDALMAVKLETWRRAV